MSEKIFIIAGNFQQAAEFRKKKAKELWDAGKDISLSHFVIVDGPESFRGFSDVHGFFVGTFRERPDIKDIVREIRRINLLPASTMVIPNMYVGHGMLPNPRMIL